MHPGFVASDSAPPDRRLAAQVGRTARRRLMYQSMPWRRISQSAGQAIESGSVRRSPYQILSASTNTKSSPRAWRAPAFRVAAICRWETATTRAPCSYAMAAVRSLDASSTTTTSNGCPTACAAFPRAFKVRPMSSSSLCAGMIKLISLILPSPTRGAIAWHQPLRQAAGRSRGSKTGQILKCSAIAFPAVARNE
jgi:hypothetical protein